MNWQTTVKILIIILALGAFLRFFDLGENSFTADEFLDINSSYGYAQTGSWQAWDFNFGRAAEMNINEARDERAFLYKWQVAGLFNFLPPTEGVARSVSALWGVFTIVLMFWTGWFYTRKKTIGLLAAFLFAVSMSGIIFDRRLRMYAMFFPVYLAFATTLFAFFEAEYKGKLALCRKLWDRFGLNFCYLIPLIVLGALSFHLHLLTLNIVFVFGVYVAWRALLMYRETGNLRNKYGMTLGLGIGGAIALMFASSYVRRLLFDGALVWFDDHYSYFGYVARDFSHPLLAFLVMAYGSYFLSKNLDRPRESAWLTLGIAVPLVMAVWFWSRNAGPQYIFFAQSFALLLAAVGTYAAGKFVTERVATMHAKQGVVAIVVLLLLLPNYGYFLEENNTYHETSSGDNPSYRKVFTYFKKNHEKGEALITRNFRNYYWSGAEVPVIDFGGELAERKFALSDLEEVLRQYPHGWIIISTNDYDYISNDAEAYIKKNMERVSNSQVRGAIEVYRW